MENAKPKLTKPEAMIFDMDGTLFKTETLLVPVFHQVFDRLREERLYEGETPPEELILSCLGMLLPEIWKKCCRTKARRCAGGPTSCCSNWSWPDWKELPSELYPQVRETLTRLKERGVRLFVASNGLEHYVKGVADTHGILPLFEGLYSAGEYRTASKVDLVKLLLDNHAIRTAWMVGDRSSDVEAGKKNGQTVIGCAYAGFGNDRELAGADALIGAFEELLELYDDAANYQ